jgi:hypothetical protein
LGSLIVPGVRSLLERYRGRTLPVSSCAVVINYN